MTTNKLTRFINLCAKSTAKELLSRYFEVVVITGEALRRSDYGIVLDLIPIDTVDDFVLYLACIQEESVGPIAGVAVLLKDSSGDYEMQTNESGQFAFSVPVSIDSFQIVFPEPPKTYLHKVRLASADMIPEGVRWSFQPTGVAASSSDRRTYFLYDGDNHCIEFRQPKVPGVFECPCNLWVLQLIYDGAPIDTLLIPTGGMINDVWVESIEIKASVAESIKDQSKLVCKIYFRESDLLWFLREDRLKQELAMHCEADWRPVVLETWNQLLLKAANA